MNLFHDPATVLPKNNATVVGVDIAGQYANSPLGHWRRTLFCRRWSK